MLTADTKKKRFTQPKSKDRAKKDLLETFKNVMSETIAGDLSGKVADQVSTLLSEKDGKDRLRELLKTNGYKFADGYLDKLIVKLKGGTFNMRLIPSDEMGEHFNRLVSDLPEQSGTLLVRALDTKQLVGIMAEDDGEEYLMCVVAVFDNFIWNINPPSDATFKNGDTLDTFQLEEMISHCLKLLMNGKEPEDRGMVKYHGPKGGEGICGEALTFKKKDKMKPEEIKKIPLLNDYSISLFE